MRRSQWGLRPREPISLLAKSAWESPSPFAVGGSPVASILPVCTGHRAWDSVSIPQLQAVSSPAFFKTTVVPAAVIRRLVRE